jgi:hypothetical protein
VRWFRSVRDNPAEKLHPHGDDKIRIVPNYRRHVNRHEGKLVFEVPSRFGFGACTKLTPHCDCRDEVHYPTLLLIQKFPMVREASRERSISSFCFISHILNSLRFVALLESTIRYLSNEYN